MKKQIINVTTTDGETHRYEQPYSPDSSVEYEDGVLIINTATESALYAPGQWAFTRGEITNDKTTSTDNPRS